MKIKLGRNKPRSQIRRRVDNPEPKVEVAKTYSYSSRRSEDNVNLGRSTDTEKPKTNWRQRLLKIELLGVLIIALFVVYQVLYLKPEVLVKPLNSSQNITSSQLSQYQHEANKIMKSTFLDNNKVTIDGSSLVQKLRSTYPLIQSVTISLNLFSNEPTLYITQSQAILVLKTVQNEYFAINLSGQSINNANTQAGLKVGANLPLVNDQSGIAIRDGSEALPSGDVAFILTVQQELNAKGYSVSSYTLPPQSRELDVGIVGQSYIVKFNLENNDARLQSGTFLATIAQLKSQNIVPAKYIDVRVDGRAYYQ